MLRGREAVSSAGQAAFAPEMLKAEKGAAGLLNPRVARWKRAVDVAVAFLLFPIALPLGLLISLAIRIDSRGPVFFRHQRVGLGNSRFQLWKFRSMVENADAVLEQYLAQHPELRREWDQSHKLKNDPRVTRVGRWLRRSSLDELPQLWNVLRGDMSLIGPRPIVEQEIPKYGEAFSLYVRVRPGLTGPWQVSGRSDTSYARRKDLDVHYILHWSPWRDVAILAKTIRVVLLGHGAY